RREVPAPVRQQPADYRQQLGAGGRGEDGPLMGVLDSLAGDVEAGLGQLHSAMDQVARLGGVTDLAGHPTALRRTADVWRKAASDLRYLESGLTGWARSAGSFWQEPSADAFAA